MENKNIKKWYLETYPNDELGIYLNDNITFKDLFETLDNYKCVYSFLGVSDSIIRERCFKELAKIMKVDYDYIHEQWLRS